MKCQISFLWWIFRWYNIISAKKYGTRIRTIDVFAYFILIINPRGHDISLLVSQCLATPRSVIMWRCVDFMSIAYFAMYVVHFMLLGILRIPYLHFSSYSKWKWATTWNDAAKKLLYNINAFSIQRLIFIYHLKERK